LWIGGVAMVTTVLLPSVRSMKTPEERVASFETVERRFAWQARGTTLLTALTGLYMVHAMQAWGWYFEPTRWYLHALCSQGASNSSVPGVIGLDLASYASPI